MPKLAEALVERKSLQDRLARLHVRVAASAKVQEGDQPAENPAELIEEGRRILAEIKQITVWINKTNMEAKLPGDNGNHPLSLMEAIAERDRLRDEHKFYDHLSTAARIEPNRVYGATRNEVKWKSTVNVAEIQKQLDSLSQSYRLLDTRIQEANWTIDLLTN